MIKPLSHHRGNARAPRAAIKASWSCATVCCAGWP